MDAKGRGYDGWPNYSEDEEEVTYRLEGPIKEHLQMISAITDAIFCINTWIAPDATSHNDMELYLNEAYLDRTKTMLVHFREKLREL